MQSVKNPILTIIKQPNENFDFIPFKGTIVFENARKERFIGLQIRVNTILRNLIQNSNNKKFP